MLKLIRRNTPLVMAFLAVAVGCGKRSEPTRPPMAHAAAGQATALPLHGQHPAWPVSEVPPLTETDPAEPDAYPDGPDHRLFYDALDDYIGRGQVDKAKELYLAALKEQPEWIIDGYDPIMQALLMQGDHAAARDWAERLLTEALPALPMASVYRDLFTALCALGQHDRLAVAIPLLLERLDPSDRDAVLRHTLQLLIQQEEQDAFEDLVALLTSYVHRFPSLSPLITGARIRMLLQGNHPDDATPLLLGDSEGLPEQERCQLTLALLEQLAVAGRPPAAIDDLVRRLLAHRAPDSATTEAIVRWWLGDARKRQDYDALLSRFGEGIAAQVNSAIPIAALRQSYYEIRTKGTPEQQAACGSFVHAVLTCEGLSDKDKEDFSLLYLDEEFFRGRFVEAQHLVDLGIPGQSEEWHAMTRNKLGAHAALEEGRHEEAIAGFRRHIELLEQGDIELTNPVEQKSVHVDAIVGFNEKRIGDIYLTLGRPDEARAAYARARQRCEHALAVTPEGSLTHSEANTTLSQIPSPDATLVLR